MTQLESELTRLIESQHAAREERLKLSHEVARLREDNLHLGVPVAPLETSSEKDDDAAFKALASVLPDALP